MAGVDQVGDHGVPHRPGLREAVQQDDRLTVGRADVAHIEDQSVPLELGQSLGAHRSDPSHRPGPSLVLVIR